MDQHEIQQMWSGYCPESELQGKKVRMRLNRSDLFESEETGLQIAMIPGIQAVIMKTRGRGHFRSTVTFGDEVEGGEFLSPQTTDSPPFNSPPVIFAGSAEIDAYIKQLDK